MQGFFVFPLNCIIALHAQLGEDCNELIHNTRHTLSPSTRPKETQNPLAKTVEIQHSDTSKSVTRSPRARTGEASWERREGGFYGPNRVHACVDIIWSNEPSYHHTSKTT